MNLTGLKLRITSPGHFDSNFADTLASKMGLQLISPGPAFDSVTGLPSDDGTIRQITREITDSSRREEGKCGFLIANFPGNVIQAQSLDMALANANQPLDTCIMSNTTKTPENRAKMSLIRYYRSQNKLILIEESSTIEDICSKIYTTYQKRRTHD